MDKFNILLIEDEEAEINLLCDCFEKSKMQISLTTKTDGEEAILHLSTLTQHDELPDLVLLDLNMPKKNGIEVLSFIRSKALLKPTLVIVMTNSDSPKDISDCYALNANCYLKKPDNLKDYDQLVKIIENFWLSMVSLPHKGQAIH